MWHPGTSAAATEDPAGGGRDRGSSLVAVLLLACLLAAVGTSVALVADIETMVASNHREVVGLRYDAEAVSDVIVQELALMADWNGVLRGTRRSVMDGALVLPQAPAALAVDANVETALVQQDSYGGWTWGADTPRWRLFAQGVAGRDLPFGGLSDRACALVWVSDDIAETDADPFTDTNGIIVVRTRVTSVRAGRADVVLVIGRENPGVVRLVSSRLIR